MHAERHRGLAPCVNRPTPGGGEEKRGQKWRRMGCDENRFPGANSGRTGDASAGAGRRRGCENAPDVAPLPEGGGRTRQDETRRTFRAERRTPRQAEKRFLPNDCRGAAELPSGRGPRGLKIRTVAREMRSKARAARAVRQNGEGWRRLSCAGPPYCGMTSSVTEYIRRRSLAAGTDTLPSLADASSQYIPGCGQVKANSPRASVVAVISSGRSR